MASISTKKRSRTIILKFMNDLLADLESLYGEEEVSENDLIEIISKKELLEKKYKKCEQLSEEIGDLIDKDEDFEKDMEFVQRYEVELSKKLSALSHFIDENKILKEKAKSDTVRCDSKSNVTVKLPRFEIKKFAGERTEWQSFKQSFEEAIDKQTTLSSIEKMNYLLCYLSDEALNCVKGLQLSNENYETAKDMLDKRFGNKQLVINSHVKKLMHLSYVEGSNVKGLRTLFDTIETEVRSLDAIGCDIATYGIMLIPIIMDKLPQEIQLVIPDVLIKLS